MKKWLIIFILIICLTPIVLGLDLPICGDNLRPNTPCAMITPTIPSGDCSIFNYTIYNSDQTLNEQDNLTVFNDSIYYFNFSESAGEYVIQLCDGTTREIRLEDEEMAWLAIVFSIALMSMILVGTSFFIKNKELEGIRGILFLFGLTFAFILGLIPLAITYNPSDSGAFNPVAIGIFSVVSIFLIMFVWLYGKFLIFRMFKSLRKGSGERDKWFGKN